MKLKEIFFLFWLSFVLAIFWSCNGYATKILPPLDFNLELLGEKNFLEFGKIFTVRV